LKVVNKGAGAFIPRDQQTFTLYQVRAIVDAVRKAFAYDLDDELSPDEIAELHERDQEMDQCQGRRAG
jgi:hypothetical protein